MKAFILILLCLGLSCSKKEPIEEVKEEISFKTIEVEPDLPDDYFDDLSKVVLYFKPNKVTTDPKSIELIKSYIKEQKIRCLCKGMPGELHFKDGSIVKMDITGHCMTVSTSKNCYSVDRKLVKLLLGRK